jgi:hypothetical protein
LRLMLLSLELEEAVALLVHVLAAVSLGVALAIVAALLLVVESLRVAFMDAASMDVAFMERQ